MAAASTYSIHLSTANSWRGGENQVWLLTRGLIARGQKVLVVAPKGAPLLERCAEAGIPVRGMALRGGVDPFATVKLMSLLRREQPDIFHLHDGHAVTQGQLAGRMLSRKKCGVVAHRRTVFALKGRWKYSGRVDRVIAISAAVREELIKAKIEAQRVAVVYSGMEFSERLTADAPAVRELRARLGIPAGALIIAHAAALTSEKRQADMIAALARANDTLKARKLPDVHLALAGTGDQEQTLRQEVQRRGVAGTVHFAGFMKDLRPLWGASELALFASEAEGLCTALIEAQGAGLPAVVTRAGGMVEVVEEGATGLTVPVGDVEALATQIVKLVEDKALRQRYGSAAMKRARTLFSSDAMVDGVLKVYREIH